MHVVQTSLTFDPASQGDDTFGVRARQVLDKIILTCDIFRDWPAHEQILPGIAWRARRHLNILGYLSIAVGQTVLRTERTTAGAEASSRNQRAPTSASVSGIPVVCDGVIYLLQRMCDRTCVQTRDLKILVYRVLRAAATRTQWGGGRESCGRRGWNEGGGHERKSRGERRGGREAGNHEH